MQIKRHQLHALQGGVDALLLRRVQHLGEVLQHAAVAREVGDGLEHGQQGLTLSAACIDDEGALRVGVSAGVLEHPAEIVGSERRGAGGEARHGGHEGSLPLGGGVDDVEDVGAEFVFIEGEGGVADVGGLNEAEVGEVVGHGAEGGHVVVDPGLGVSVVRGERGEERKELAGLLGW